MAEQQTLVKICGMMRDADIEYMNVCKPDLVGFVFAPSRRRTILPTDALRWRRMLDPAIRTVGVFIDAREDEIREIVEMGVINILQLHGKENDATIRGLRDRTGLPVIKAFTIDSMEDIRRAEQSAADYVMLDHGGGGLGNSFDHSLLSGIRRPYFLAGGLTPKNVGEEVRTWHPYAVDVSSGVEKNGYKDETRIRTFVEAVRGA